MPIPVGVVEPITPTPDIPTIPEPEFWSRSVITWTSATGESVVLTGDISGNNTGVVVEQGVKGFDAPPYELQLEEYPSLDGSVFRGVRASTREIMLPLFLWAPDRRRLLDLKRRILRLFNPRKGEGVLRVTEHDGSSRFIRCFYASGLEGDEQDAGGFTWTRYGVVLRAKDPYWYGDKITLTFDRSSPNTVNFYDGRGVRGGETIITPSPFLGLHISSDYPNAAETLIAISGDDDTWPVWTITGYRGSQIILSNVSTGSSFVLSYESDDPTKVIRIDTRPGRKWVYEGVIQNGQFIREKNLWPYLEARDLWPIPVGESRATVEIRPIEGTQPGGVVVMEYEPRFLGA